MHVKQLENNIKLLQEQIKLSNDLYDNDFTRNAVVGAYELSIKILQIDIEFFKYLENGE